MTSEYHKRFLVIGSGIAGLYYALKVAEHAHVTIVTKGNLETSNSYMAQGGIASVQSDADNYKKHYWDTIKAGGGLCNKTAVKNLVESGPECINELISLGTPFTKSQNKHSVSLGREGGHSEDRIVHVKDQSGKAIMDTIIGHIKTHPNIEILEHHFVYKLLLSNDSKRCFGVNVKDIKTGINKYIVSSQTMLSTGGGGQIFSKNSNSSSATGDGFLLAYEAGAEFENMEFIQFHPTAFFDIKKNKTTFLLSEALRGAGGILKNASAKPFVKKHHEMGSLAPRDIVSRAMYYEMINSGVQHLWLDMRHVDSHLIKNNFPFLYHKCLESGIDMTNEMIPVAPAAHFFCGGVKTDLEAKTTLNGLLACGEIACTGVHGANRLASNSLLEGLVFANRAAKESINNIYFQKNKKTCCKKKLLKPVLFPALHKSNILSGQEITSLREKLKNSMWKNAGIVRNEVKLKKAEKDCKNILKIIENSLAASHTDIAFNELKSLAVTAHLLVSAALKRTNSIGCHFREDHHINNLKQKILHN